MNEKSFLGKENTSVSLNFGESITRFIWSLGELLLSTIAKRQTSVERRRLVSRKLIKTARKFNFEIPNQDKSSFSKTLHKLVRVCCPHKSVGAAYDLFQVSLEMNIAYRKDANYQVMIDFVILTLCISFNNFFFIFKTF